MASSVFSAYMCYVLCVLWLIGMPVLFPLMMSKSRALIWIFYRDGGGKAAAGRLPRKKSFFDVFG